MSKAANVVSEMAIVVSKAANVVSEMAIVVCETANVVSEAAIVVSEIAIATLKTLFCGQNTTFAGVRVVF
ncbi:hypothetical protein NIES37_16050 [Tolypothrix tenuis PCC 7101]|uniref:Uncharacterized protein n=1 Tax=Tolypothrix tenuis PCC 7101 TaxID=231146 RepID=A0A1Z4MW57_9CYAN|nr:hypothetical protein [Aulosira sp. FACHB-113]BAY97661.1 hypothetical protein NIES37_16050 [Tolypothrix tenuis PCC 7101]BAZ71832.1 hypothetical protein NIES50_03790 [Aulosira laxa NIES-50]